MAGGLIQRVKIAGIASAVPGEAQGVERGSLIPAEELAKVVEKTGVKRRHLVNAEVCSSDLCLAAAEKLLGELEWSRDSVDLLVFVSQTPDFHLPATSCVLHGKLGLAKSCAAFDVALGCSGYVYGLHVAATLVASGAYGRALLLAGDTISKVVAPEDRSVAYVFGDAGSATALEFSEAAPALGFDLGTDGTGVEHLQIPAGGFRHRSTAATAALQEREAGNRRADEHLFMNGAEVFNFTIREVPPLVKRVTERVGWNVSDVDCWVMHQANRFMLEYLAKRMKLPADRVALALEDYGNTSCASIPLALSHRFSGGAVKPSRCVLAGFGVGFSWAGATVSLEGTAFPPILQLPTRS